jgi:hypothetical protein
MRDVALMEPDVQKAEGAGDAPVTITYKCVRFLRAHARGA